MGVIQDPRAQPKRGAAYDPVANRDPAPSRLYRLADLRIPLKHEGTRDDPLTVNEARMFVAACPRGLVWAEPYHQFPHYRLEGWSGTRIFAIEPRLEPRAKSGYEVLGTTLLVWCAVGKGVVTRLLIPDDAGALQAHLIELGKLADSHSVRRAQGADLAAELRTLAAATEDHALLLTEDQHRALAALPEVCADPECTGWNHRPPELE